MKDEKTPLDSGKAASEQPLSDDELDQTAGGRGINVGTGMILICDKCRKIFQRSDELHKHERKCNGK